MGSAYVLTVFVWGIMGVNSVTGGNSGRIDVEYRSRVECKAAQKLVGELYGDYVMHRAMCVRKGSR